MVYPQILDSQVGVPILVVQTWTIYGEALLLGVGLLFVVHVVFLLGIGYEMPEIVNCSARTGLDMLAKHFADTIGFDIVFFLPDSEEDFPSYTEFLQYMTDLNRAGVAKFGDGTNLFLVAPSDFLRTVLKVSGPDQFILVLKFPSHTYDKFSGPAITQRHVDRVPPVTAASSAPAGLSLTPELVTSLASLANANSDGQQPSGDTFQEQRASNLTGDIMRSNQVHYADKNARYQATLRLAANFLSQIQQKQSGAETGGSH